MSTPQLPAGSQSAPHAAPPHASIRREVAKHLLDELDPMIEEIVIRNNETLATYRTLSVDHIQPHSTWFIKRVLERLRDGMGPFSAVDDPEMWMRSGETRAAEGVSIEDLLQANVNAADIVYRHAREYLHDAPSRDGALVDILEFTTEWLKLGVRYLAAGHRKVELESTRRAQRERTEFVRRVLLGGLGGTELRTTAATYGLDPDQQYYAVRGRPIATVTFREIERFFRVGEPTAGRRGMVELISEHACGFIRELPSRRAIAIPIGLAGPVGMPDLPEAFRDATRAHATAEAVGVMGCRDLDGLGLFPALVADHAVGDAMVRRFIQPVENLGAAGDALLHTVSCYLANNRRLNMTADALYMHVNTLRYRLSRFEELTGSSLRHTDDVLMVWWALERRRLRSTDLSQS